MAEAIIKLWDRIQKDGAENVRGEARRIAEQHYDLGRTVSELMKLCEAEFKLKSEPRLTETQKRFDLADRNS